VIIDSSGNIAPFISERRYFDGVVSSPDGRKAAVVLPAPKGTYEIWVADLDRPGLKRVAAVPNADCAYAQWSPNGERIAYGRQGHDKDDGIYVQRVDAPGIAPQLILKSESPDVFLIPQFWTHDGSGLVISKIVNGQGDILFVNIPSDGKPATTRVLRGTPYNERVAKLSPDGSLVAFTSNESGNYEIYVASFLPDGTLGQPLMVPGGANVQLFPGASMDWAGDSRRLFYDSIPYKVMSVTIETRPSLSASSPVVVLDMDKLRGFEWDALPDGRLLVIQKGEGEDNITQYNIVLNWFSELRERMKASGSGAKR
jgi:dipeptidyl aminopeptidase/acylaminoacyl peptidase